jgi:hypothetical protein
MNEDVQSATGKATNEDGTISEVKILVNTMDGETFEISVAETATVLETKLAIQKIHGNNARTVQLCIPGLDKPLEDSAFLSHLDYGGSIFMLQLPGECLELLSRPNFTSSIGIPFEWSMDDNKDSCGLYDISNERLTATKIRRLEFVSTIRAKQ